MRLHSKQSGLYLHIPYCLHKCGYCDFNSHKINTEEMDQYVEALIREIETYSQSSGPTSGKIIETIFFGGGTPTTLPVKSLARILETCRDRFPLSPDCEITLEANPATILKDELKDLRSAGFNRLSVGVQSFHKKDLDLLERVHSVEEVYLTLDRAREAGFDNLSIDLMFALPGQTLAVWESNLDKAIKINPEHLSTYNLTVEPNTAFQAYQSRGELVMPPEDLQLEHYQASIDRLTQAGYKHYEISNFAKPGKECRHNMVYWENREYLGLGAGASSYVNGVRTKNWNLPSRYIREVNSRGRAVEFAEKLESGKALGETLMLGLRLLEKGVSMDQLDKRFRISFREVYGKVLSALSGKNLISIDQDRITLTRKGLFLADSVILEFIS